MAEYAAKRISELQEATNLTNQDYLVINEFSPATGYTLTKKVMASKLGEFLFNNFSKKQLSDEYELSDLAHYDTKKLLNEFMLSSGHERGMGMHSLALSAIDDLNLGDLSSFNIADLNLNQYVAKRDANGTYNAGVNEFINGITLQDGKIVSITTGKLVDEVQVDSTLDSTSSHPVQNAAIKAALDTKLSKADGNMTYSPVQGVYVAGFSQRDGVVCDVRTYPIPTQAIDDSLSRTSTNPVLNKVITSKLDELAAGITGEVADIYVKKIDANTVVRADSGKYISSITLTDGKIVSIGQSNLPAINLPPEVKIDTKLDSNSTNPVLNKVITSKISDIENRYVLKTSANNVLNAATGSYITGITLTNGKVTDIRTAALPAQVNGMKYSTNSSFQYSGLIFDNKAEGNVVFTASTDCIVSFSVSIAINITSCGHPVPRYAWITYAGTTDKKQLIEMRTKGAGLTNCMLILKAGDKITINGYCQKSHGTTWSISGTALART